MCEILKSVYNKESFPSTHIMILYLYI